MSSNFLDKTGLSYLWTKITALIPSKLPNPQKLTVNGTEYDGSTAVTVTISGGGGGGLSSIVAGTGAGSEIFNQDENNTLDPTTVTGQYSHVEGSHPSLQNVGASSHIEGYNHQVGSSSTSSIMHIEGNSNRIDVEPNSRSGYVGSHIEGHSNRITEYTYDDNRGLHIEGFSNQVTGNGGDGIHIEGSNMRLSTVKSNVHIEGSSHQGSWPMFGIHLEGSYHNCTSSGYGGGQSHIEGTSHTFSNFNNAYAVHVEGYNNTNPGCAYQHIQGYFADTSNSGQLAHIVGNGSTSARSNAHTLDWDGNAWYEGTVSCGTTEEPVSITEDNQLTTKAYVDALFTAAEGLSV